jgi:GAF domain-containing protein
MTSNHAQLWLEKKVTARTDISSAVLLLEQNGSLTQAAAWPRAQAIDAGLTVIAKEAFRTQSELEWAGSSNRAGQNPLNKLNSEPIIQDGKLVGAIGFLSHAANEPIPPPLSPAVKTKYPNALNDGKALNILQVVVTALGTTEFAEAAASVATELAVAFNCDRVSIGLTKGRFNKIVAVSHSANVQPTQSLMQLLGAAMDEAVDQRACIQFPPVPDSEHQITLSHAELAVRHNIQQILTVGMVHNDLIIGALLFERRDLDPFGDEQIDLLEQLASTLGPILEIKRNNELSWLNRIQSDLKQSFANSTSRQGRGFRALVVLGAVLLVVLPAIPIQYSLNAPARLEGVSQRMIVAPIDGYLRSVYVRPGDTIKAGQVLADMADEDLRLEKRRWEGEVIRHESVFGEALKRQDRAQMASAQARVSESRAQLALVENQIERVNLTAPFDGVVLKGDLKQQLGAPLKRGDSLFILAPANEYRVVVSVEDNAIESVKQLARGQIRLTAMPDTVMNLQVERILPVANVQDGRNAFEIEAKLDTTIDSLRPGMEGVAKIQAGKRSLYWIIGHRLAAWFKLTFWSWSH